jgi:tetratricopeptide (TPR) repeat protein
LEYRRRASELAALPEWGVLVRKAESAYQEGVSTYRELAQANPEAYLPDVATTLNNLANLYSATQRMKEAEAACREAEGIPEPLWFVNPELHGDQMGRILLMRALLCESLGESATNARALARRALTAVCNRNLKQVIRQLTDQLCVDQDLSSRKPSDVESSKIVY